jgi:hypothetical protein
VLHELTGDELARAKVDGLAADGRGLALAGRAGTVEGELDLAPFDRVLVSANGELEGATLAISARVKLDDGAWTDWLELGVLGAPSDRVPRSEKAAPGPARVAVDVIELERPRGRALAWRARLERKGDGAARIRRVAVVAWEHGSRSPPRRDHPAWGRVLDVPARSQKVEDAKIAGRICSPTSLSMVLAFHGKPLPTAQVAAAVLDRTEQIYGNWVLNVGFAGSLGLRAVAARLGSIDELESEIEAGRPVVISHRWSEGQLRDAPIRSSEGHLIVVVGFTREGDVVVNDPAADPAHVRRTYARADLEKTWLGNGDGVCYLVSPEPGR